MHGMNQADTLRTELRIFVNWACALGVALPLVLAGLLELYRYKCNVPTVFFPELYFMGFLTLIVALGIPYYLSNWFTEHPNSVGAIKVWLYVLGCATAGCMGVIIVYSGGVLKSPFAFYLLYIPSIVALAFTPTSPKLLKSPGVLIASVVCGLLMLWGLFCAEEAPGYKTFYDSHLHRYGCLVIIIIQLASIVRLRDMRKSMTE